jgi:hypothetical protein
MESMHARRLGSNPKNKIICHLCMTGAKPWIQLENRDWNTADLTLFQQARWTLLHGLKTPQVSTFRCQNLCELPIIHWILRILTADESTQSGGLDYQGMLGRISLSFLTTILQQTSHERGAGGEHFLEFHISIGGSAPEGCSGVCDGLGPKLRFEMHCG